MNTPTIDVSPGSGQSTTDNYSLDISADQLDELGTNLVEATPDYGKASLELSEKAAEQFEINDNSHAVQQARMPHQEELEGDRPGRVLGQMEFLSMLRRIDPTFFYGNSSQRGMIGLGYLKQGVPTYTGVAAQVGAMNEWEEVRLDSHGLGSSLKYRGWRTVLLRLIQQDIIPEADVTRVFGEASGRFAGRYNRQLWEHRNHRSWDHD